MQIQARGLQEEDGSLMLGDPAGPETAPAGGATEDTGDFSEAPPELQAYKLQGTQNRMTGVW